MPIRERVPIWREAIGRQIVHLDIEPQSDGPFEGEMTLRAMPGLRVFMSIGSPAHYRRTAKLIADDGDDSVALLVNLGGTMCVTQNNHTHSLGIGDAVAVLHSEPALMEHAKSHFLALVVPHAALAPRVTCLLYTSRCV